MSASISYECPLDALQSRIWVDGCFDFAHHGHAGAMLQARRLGKELYVGVHSDEEITKNKGPTVMHLDERMVAVEGCKWCTKAIADAPYTTDPKVMDQYNCKYVVHGDDITTNADGEDCYQVMKDLGRFIVVKRTPNISTTDLVGRMLLSSKSHHISTITDLDWEQSDKHPILEPAARQRFQEYATGEDGKSLGSLVLINTSQGNIHQFIEPLSLTKEKFSKGCYYIDGGFDLFHPGHIKLLEKLHQLLSLQGYAVLVGINDDDSINSYKGQNYPIMNIFERSLCVLQSRYLDGILIGAPYTPTSEWTKLLKEYNIKAIFHGPYTTTTTDKSVYKDVEELYKDLGPHQYDDITSQIIVNRVLDYRLQYEERQRKKGWKSEIELKLKQEEDLGR